MKLTLGKTPSQLVRMLEQALCKQDQRWMPITFPENQEAVEITPANRNEIVRWLAQLNKKFYFAPETFALAVTVLDRFLNIVKCRPRYLRIIGLASFYLAAKTVEEDEVLPETLELVRSSECGCSVAEVLRMERIILDKLQWDLNAATPLHFLHILYALLLSQQPRLLDHVCGVTASRQLSLLTDKLAHCLGTEHRLALHPPATLATALLSLELELFAQDWLPASVWLQTIAKCSHSGFLACRELVSRCLASQHMSHVYAYACRQQPRTAHKRKMSVLDDSEDEDEDIYDGIKRLYSEDNDPPAMVSCRN